MKKPVANKLTKKQQRLTHVNEQIEKTACSLFFDLMRVNIGPEKDELVGGLVRHVSDFAFYATERTKLATK